MTQPVSLATFRLTTSSLGVERRSGQAARAGRAGTRHPIGRTLRLASRPPAAVRLRTQALGRRHTGLRRARQAATRAFRVRFATYRGGSHRIRRLAPSVAADARTSRAPNRRGQPPRGPTVLTGAPKRACHVSSRSAHPMLGTCSRTPESERSPAVCCPGKPGRSRAGIFTRGSRDPPSDAAASSVEVCEPPLARASDTRACRLPAARYAEAQPSAPRGQPEGRSPASHVPRAARTVGRSRQRSRRSGRLAAEPGAGRTLHHDVRDVHDSTQPGRRRPEGQVFRPSLCANLDWAGARCAPKGTSRASRPEGRSACAAPRRAPRVRRTPKDAPRAPRPEGRLDRNSPQRTLRARSTRKRASRRDRLASEPRAVRHPRGSTRWIALAGSRPRRPDGRALRRFEPPTERAPARCRAVAWSDRHRTTPKSGTPEDGPRFAICHVLAEAITMTSL